MSNQSFLEPKMFDFNGGELTIAPDGDLLADKTLETLVYLSFYNGSSDLDAIKKDPCKCEFEDATDTKITPRNLKNIENKASNSLQWMITEGLAKSISVQAISEKIDWVKVIVSISTDRDLEVYTFEKSNDKYSFPAKFVRAYVEETGQYATQNGQYAVGVPKN